MNKYKIITLTILIIFCIGMSVGGVSANHTYKKGKYEATVSDSQYKKIQDVKKNGSNYDEMPESKLPNFKVKTKHKYSYKKPVYKTKKVTKYKWNYKTVKAWEDNYELIDNDTISVSHYEYRIPHKYSNDWKYVKEYSKSSAKKDTGYYIFKKKVKYTTPTKIKTGYKKAKVPIYAKIGITKTVNPKNNNTYNYHPWIQFNAKTNTKTIYLTGKKSI